MTNIQDGSIVHVAKTNISGNVLPTTIGSNVTIGKLFLLPTSLFAYHMTTERLGTAQRSIKFQQLRTAECSAFSCFYEDEI
jgi:hypothetical protein